MRHTEVYACLRILQTQLSINPVRSCQTLYTVIKELSRWGLSSPSSLEPNWHLTCFIAVSRGV